jgi:hypothetical protein
MRAFLGLVVIASIAGRLVAQEQPSSNTVRAASPPQSPHIGMTPESITWNAIGNGQNIVMGRRVTVLPTRLPKPCSSVKRYQ